MKKRTFLLATSLLAAAGLSLRAQDAPSAPPAPAAAAAPSAAAHAPVVAAVPAAPSVAVVMPLPPASVAPALAPLPPQQSEARVFLLSGNYLGIQAEEVTRENMGRYGMSEARGVGVRSVLKDSPAERAGLRENDVIVSFDGEAVMTVRKLDRLIDESAPEQQVRLTIRRGGAEQQLTVRLGKREHAGLFDDDAWRKQTEEWNKNSEQWQRHGQEMRKQMEEWRKNNPGIFSMSYFAGRRIGVSTNSLGKQLAEYFGVASGVLITNVEEKSPAASAGLRAGDIVTEVDGEKIDDASDLSRAISRKEEGEVTLTIVRDRNRRTVRVTPEKRKSPAFEMLPGTFRIEGPRIAISAPDVRIGLPTINIIPRLKMAPKVIAIGPGRIL